MSFKFPSFNLQSIQDSLPKVDLENITKSFSNVNPGKTVDSWKESIQPFTNKTTQYITTQLHQVQQLAATHTNSNIEVSELPGDYLELENNCDLLLKLYTELIQFTNDTFNNVSYDYPPGNYAITKIRDAHVGSVIGNKFNQLKNVSSPQELEKVLLGGEPEDEETVSVQTTSVNIPKTLYGQLSTITSKHGNELKASNEELSFALFQISSTYLEIANARLDQDDKIIQQLNHQLVTILNEKFIKVNELRKKVYAARSEFDYLRSKSTSEEEENEELIAKEDDLVSATEVAVLEMKKLLRPSKNINLLKVFVAAQKEWFILSAKKLTSLLDNLEKIEIQEDEEEDLE